MPHYCYCGEASEHSCAYRAEIEAWRKEAQYWADKAAHLRKFQDAHDETREHIKEECDCGR